MDDHLKAKAFNAQTSFLKTWGDQVWCEMCDEYDLYETIGDRPVPCLSFCTSDEQNRRYQTLVARNVAAEHALIDSGTPQVVKRGKHWVLCDPDREKANWQNLKEYGLRLTGAVGVAT
jgi:hypothetical protein